MIPLTVTRLSLALGQCQGVGEFVALPASEVIH